MQRPLLAAVALLCALACSAGAQTISGILNGVDYDEWNPESDRFIAIRREFDPDGVFLNDHLRPLFA